MAKRNDDGIIQFPEQEFEEYEIWQCSCGSCEFRWDMDDGLVCAHCFMIQEGYLVR